MRKFFIFAVFLIIVAVAIIFLFQLYQPTGGRIQERLAWPNTISKEISVTHKKSIHYYTVPATKKETPKTTTTTTKPVYYSYYAKNNEASNNLPTKNSIVFRDHIATILSETSSAAVSDTAKNMSQTSSNATKTTAKATKVAYYTYSTSNTEKLTPKTSEAVLKYVLFSVSYDSNINAGETQSFQLTMSPRSALAQLENVLKEKKLQQNQINDIEKIQKQYKYVSATLLAKNSCLIIEKKMPEEDKVYLQSINESTADAVWQWDLTAPETPSTAVCNLSLFIRFCLNQDDCIPNENPDKKFAIFIHITLANKIYTWFANIGNLANSGTNIVTFIGILIPLLFGVWIWIKKRAAKKRHARR